MRALWKWLLQVLVALDQLGTALLGGWADETMSSYAYRLHVQGKPWGFMRHVIDAIFFWQKGHCEASYRAERARAQMPPELRSDTLKT